MKVPRIDDLTLPQVLAFLKEHDNEAVGLLLAAVAYKRAGNVNSAMGIVTRKLLDRLGADSQALQVIDDAESSWQQFLTDWNNWTKENRERAQRWLHERHLAPPVNGSGSERPPDPPPPKDPTPIEFRIMYAALAYQIGKDPSILGKLLEGAGEVIAGVGEIVPG